MKLKQSETVPMLLSERILISIIIICFLIYCSIYYRNIGNLCMPTLILNVSFRKEDDLCPVQYKNKELVGDKLVSILGQKDECCELCVKTQDCKGYTWSSDQNGLCELKSNIKNFVDKEGVYSGVGPEHPGIFLPHGKDNTLPLNDTNLMKILPPHGCNSSTKLIAAVRSAPNEFDRRKWIRNNWANTHSNSTQVIFVIANHKDNDTNLRIQSEHEVYGDILWLDYEDGYYSLPMKNYGYYEYAIKYCPNTKCVLNLDSDTVVNLPGFEKLCAVSNESVPMITGRLYGGSPVVRDTNSKWYVPRYVYEKEVYPLYPYGWVKFITGLGALQKLQDTLRIKTPFLVSENYRRLPEDSVYHGDVVHLAGIQLRDVGGINFGQISHWSDSSNGNQKIPLVVQVGEDHRDRIWKEMQTS